MEDTLTTDQITLNNEFLCQEKSGKSEVWSNFSEIINKEKQSIGYVICKNCQQIFKYDATKTGTSHLKRHKCSVNQKKITSYISMKTVPTVIKNSVTKKLVDLVCKDIRPFEIISGQGFREYSQELINIGATYGSLSVDDLLPHPTTVSRNVIKDAELVKATLASNLKIIFQEVGGAFTTDMWTDDYRKISYISLTVHYIENWQLKEQVLAVSKFPNVSHTAEQIKKVVLGILRSYNLTSEIMKRSIFVTDSGANFVAAFRALNHIPCVAHR